MTLPRRIRACLAAGILAIAIAPVAAGGGASTTVDWGQVSSYTAPDPVTPADGALGIGNLAPWPITADATLSPAVASVLPSLAGSGPSCFAMDLDGLGAITALDFAAEGSIRGPVVLDSGLGFYIFDDRLIIPPFVTDAFPGLGAIFPTSAAAGTDVDATFEVDTTTGALTGIDASAFFCGPGGVDAGRGQVGDAVIPAEVLDEDDLDTLGAADGKRVCATVHTFGTIGTEGAIDLETTVDIEAQGLGPDATPPDTAAAGTAPSPGSRDIGFESLALLAFVALIVLNLARPARRRAVIDPTRRADA